MKNSSFILLMSLTFNGFFLLLLLRRSAQPEPLRRQGLSNKSLNAEKLIVEERTGVVKGKILIFRSHFGGKSYAPARDSVHCFAKTAGHELIDVDLDSDEVAKTNCAEFKDRNFRRHCILAHYLDKSNASYAFAVDGDVAVINPQKIEKYIDSSASLIFFERFKTLEVAACSFIVKNDAYGIQFLMDWARYYYKLPKNLGFDNSDNGALLSLLLEKRSVSNFDRTICTKFWNVSNLAADYIRYMHCVHVFLGAKRVNVTEKVKILRRGHSWMRDENTADGYWCENDFFFHQLKSDAYNTNPEDTSSPFSQQFNVDQCELGKAEASFHLKPKLKISCEELRQKLRKRLVIPETQPVPYLHDSDIDCWPHCDD